MKKSPFKRIDCRLIDVLLLLPANALKVWLCHFNHEGASRLSYPSLDRLCEKTDLNSKTVKAQRQWLIKNGWLKKTGERLGNGKFKVPVITALQGTLPQGKADGRANNRVPSGTAVQDLDHGSRGPNCSGHETKILLPARDQNLDPKVKPLQVNPSGVAQPPKTTAIPVSVDERDKATSKSISVHSQGTTVPELVAPTDGNFCTNTELSSEPELTPHQVLERFQNTVLSLREKRKDCVTKESRDDLDQRIAAAEWGVSEQQARME